MTGQMTQNTCTDTGAGQQGAALIRSARGSSGQAVCVSPCCAGDADMCSWREGRACRAGGGDVSGGCTGCSTCPQCLRHQPTHTHALTRPSSMDMVVWDTACLNHHEACSANWYHTALTRPSSMEMPLAGTLATQCPQCVQQHGDGVVRSPGPAAWRWCCQG